MRALKIAISIVAMSLCICSCSKNPTFEEGTYVYENGKLVQSEISIKTSEVTDITQNSAVCGGIVTFNGDGKVTARGVCWSTSPNPTINNNHTTDGSGIGSFTSHLSDLASETTYYVCAYATNGVITVYGNSVSFRTNKSEMPCPTTITDNDGNIYHTVQIGSQCWMKENLRTTHYSNGESIPLGNNASYDEAYRYNPDNNSSNVKTYGYLYNWKAVMKNFASSSSNPSGVQGICPIGWHVPSDAEWMQLTDYVSSQDKYICGEDSRNIAKALASTNGWENSNNNATIGNWPMDNNATGFSAVPAGLYNNHYTGFGSNAYFWSTSQYYNYAFGIYLNYSSAYVYNSNLTKSYGYSVRCLKD